MTKDKIEVMQAFLDGKTIEHRSFDSTEEWKVVTEPVWNWYEREYRIKKEPRKFWIVNYKNVLVTYTDKEVALYHLDIYGCKEAFIIEVLEVI